MLVIHDVYASIETEVLVSQSHYVAGGCHSRRGHGHLPIFPVLMHSKPLFSDTVLCIITASQSFLWLLLLDLLLKGWGSSYSVLAPSLTSLCASALWPSVQPGSVSAPPLRPRDHSPDVVPYLMMAAPLYLVLHICLKVTVSQTKLHFPAQTCSYILFLFTVSPPT